MPRLAHLVVSNTWRYNTGWAPLPVHVAQVANAVDEHNVDGTGRLTFEAPVTALGFTQLLPNRVLAAVMSDGSWEEWQLDSADIDGVGSGAGSFVAMGYARALAKSPPVRRTDADGVTVCAFEYADLDASTHITNTVLQSLTDGGTTCFVLGTIEPTGNKTISYKGDALAALQAIATAYACEYWFERDDAGSQVKIHLVKRIGSGSTGVDFRVGQNAAPKLSQQTTDHANRVYGHAADDSTIAPNGWLITAKTGSGPWTLTLGDPNGGDGPIGMDDQLTGLYLEAVNRTTRTVVATSVFSTQQITIASNGSSYTVGDRVRVCRTAGGEGLTYLNHPAQQTAQGGIVFSKSIERDDIAATANLVPNAGMAIWTGSSSTAPDGWSAVGSPTLARTTTTGFFVTGGKSCRVQTTADGAGLATPLVNVVPTALHPFDSGYLKFLVAAGNIRVEMVATDGVSTWIVPDAVTQVASTTKKGVFDNIGVAGIDLYRMGATQVRMRIVQHGAGTADFYVDAGQITESAAQQDYVTGIGANVLWQAMNVELQLRAPLPQQFDVQVANLFQLDGTRYPQNAIILGGMHGIHDPTTGIVDSVRVLLLRRRLQLEASADVTLSTRAEDLASIVAGQDPLARQAGNVGGPIVPSGARVLTGVSVVGGTAALTASSVITAADAGKTLWVFGAGTGGAVLKTTVASVSGSTITMGTNAGQTFSGGTAIVGTAGDVLTLAVAAGGKNATGALNNDTGTLAAQVKDAQQRDVIKLFSKLLAADPDTFDAVDNGLSFLKQIPLLKIYGAQTASDATTVSVTVLGTDPSGGADPTITSDHSSAVTSLGSGQYVIARPAAGAGPLNVIFTAAKTGRQNDSWLAVAPAQDGAAGPSLDVKANVGASTASITYVGSGGTVQVSLNGGSYSTAGSSPISVSRPAAGSAPDTYAFRIAGTSQTIPGVVSIPAQDLPVTPYVQATPGTMTSTTQPFVASATDPTGAHTPVLRVKLKNTTATGSTTGAIANNTLTTLTIGETVTINRPAAGASVAFATFSADLSGSAGGYAEAPVSITNQDGGGTQPSVAAFYESAFDNTTNVITLAWTVLNPPAGGSFDVVYHQTTSDGLADDSGTVSGVSSPYGFNADSVGTIDLVPKGTSGWKYSSHTFSLRVKDSGGAVVATATISVDHYGIYDP